MLIMQSKHTIYMYRVHMCPVQTLLDLNTNIIVRTSNCQMMRIAKHIICAESRLEYNVNLFATDIDSTDIEEIYPVTVQDITNARFAHSQNRKYLKNKQFKNKDPNRSLNIIHNIHVIVNKDHCMTIPIVEIHDKVIKWYHHYLQHPGANRITETCCASMICTHT